MTERPILFSGSMVRAILEGRKTQTRRIVKHEIPQNLTHVRRLTNTNGDEGAVITEHPDMRAGQLAASVWCPYGKPGDRLWVRETHLIRGAGAVADYRADFDHLDAVGHGALYGGWCPSIHMPRWASRITLEVVAVRVERLQDISREDAAAEGVCIANEAYRFRGYGIHRWPEQNFETLWNLINGPGSWDANPWVWVVEFKVIKP